MASSVKTTAETQDTAAEVQYTPDELIGAAETFGIRSEVMAGALYGVTDETLTRAKAAVLVKKYLTREVIR